MPRHDVLGADGEEGVVDREAGQQIARRGRWGWVAGMEKDESDR